MKTFFKRAGVLCLLVILLPAISYAEIYSGSCGQDVAWKLDTETGLLEIYNSQPGGYSKMTDYYHLEVPWFNYKIHIRSVSLSGISYIGNSAFYGCSGLTSITIPESVTSIGNFAFFGCSGLTSITIPESVTSIGSCAFFGCSGLTSITIPESVTSIGGSAFYGCSSLASITIPESVTSIGGSAFYGCYFLRDKFINNSVLISENNWGATFLDEETGDGLLIKDHIVVKCRSWASSVCIPESVTSIGNDAFSGCSGLTSITIPESVTSIGGSAFYGCSGLTSITIPESVTSIRSYAFSSCSGLTSITIPESVTSIGSSAFSGCSGLTSVTIPESVNSIGSSAFASCNNLTSVTLNSNAITSATYSSSNNIGTIFGSQVKEYIINGSKIGGYAFYGCSGLTSITIPESVTSIGEYTFYNCRGLTAITIPESVTSIGNSAFSGCSGLTSITIPESVTSIGNSAFASCNNLTSITLPESVTSIGSSAFFGCSGLTSITLPESVTSIGDYAFYGCSNLTSVTLNSNAITSATYSSSKNIGTIFDSQVKKYIIGGSKIGGYAFYDCSGLESVILSDSVTSIGNSAFSGCSGLTSITLPESVTSIGSSVFSGCGGLNTIIVKQWNPKYDSRDDCNAIIETNTNTLLYGCNTTAIPESVTSIGNSAFSGCSGLTSITIPEGVTSIGEYAFSGCSGLTAVTIPEGVTSIGSSAFSVCSNLTSVTLNSNAITSATYSSSNNIGTIFGSQVKNYIIGDKVKRIGEQAFASSREVVSIDLGRNIERIQDNAFSGCDKLEEVRVKASEPPIAFSTAFPDNAYYAFLYVPEGTEALYKEDNVWGKFARIRTFKDEPEKCVLSIKSAIGGYLEMVCNTRTCYTFNIKTEKGWQVSSVSFNGADVTANITDDSYTTPLLEGDSELSVIFEMDQDEIDMVNEVESHSQLSVTTSNSTIYIHNEGDPVNSYIYTSDGKMVNSVVASYGKTTIPLQPNNIYLVKTGTRTFKVAL